jgi:hypothetical protein
MKNGIDIDIAQICRFLQLSEEFRLTYRRPINVRQPVDKD